MQTHEIVRRFTDHFVARRAHPRAQRVADPRRPDPAVRQRRAWCSSSRTSSARPPRPTRGPRRSRSACAPATSTRSARPPGTTRSSRWPGNFSFGDYFKQGAIEHAWQLVTGSQDAGGYGFDPDRHLGHRLPRRRRGRRPVAAGRRLPAERIQRRSGKDNYWDMGVPGPGGPCSEIYFDRGPEHGRDGGPEADEDRYLEIWNLVFMQDVRGERSPKDDFPPIGVLPKKNIDTGMGVERVATLLQGVESVYETDLVRPVIAPRRGALRPPLRRRPGRRRAVPGDRRPRPVRRHDHRRRRDARQRGPRLRAAPAAAPDRALGPAARRDRAGAAELRRGRARRDEPVVPGARPPTSSASRRSCGPRRRRSSPR